METRTLLPWMKFLLRFVAVYNVLAGLFMLTLTRDAYRVIGMPEPQMDFPMKLVGALVILFGYGYYLVVRHPLQNRNILLLGTLSKTAGTVLGLYYIAQGKLPLTFLPTLFLADLGYIVPFIFILRRIDHAARRERDAAAPSASSLD